MLTTGDVKTIEKVMRMVVNEVVDEKLKPIHDFQKEEKGMLSDIFNDLQEKHQFEREVDKRVTKLEQIHPDNHHVSVL
jgi:GTP1/Obg family GTP-binding protein